MGIYYDSTGKEFILNPGSMVPSDAMGAVRESGGNGTPHFPGAPIQSNNRPVMTPVAEPIRRPVFPVTEAPKPYEPHGFVGNVTRPPYVPFPRNPDALIPPNNTSTTTGSIGKNSNRYRIALIIVLATAEMRNPTESLARRVNAARKAPVYLYSDIATRFYGPDNWGHNLIYGIPNRTAVPGTLQQAHSVKRHR